MDNQYTSTLSILNTSILGNNGIANVTEIPVTSVWMGIQNIHKWVA